MSIYDEGEAVLAAERQADKDPAANPGLMLALETAYEVVWPDGDIYANRHGEIRLTVAEARATARAVGGTWRAARAPGEGRLYFYKLTCGHEKPNLYEQEPGTTLVCRGENRAAAHPATVVRLTRARDIAPGPVPGTAPAPPGERTAEATATSEQHAQSGTGQPGYPAPVSAIPPEKNFGCPATSSASAATASSAPDGARASVTASGADPDSKPTRPMTTTAKTVHPTATSVLPEVPGDLPRGEQHEEHRAGRPQRGAISWGPGYRSSGWRFAVVVGGGGCEVGGSVAWLDGREGVGAAPGAADGEVGVRCGAGRGTVGGVVLGAASGVRAGPAGAGRAVRAARPRGRGGEGDVQEADRAAARRRARLRQCGRR